MNFNTDALKKQTQDMNKAIEALRKEYQAKIQTSFHEATKSFFESTPEVSQLMWTQYSPYWNDGDECTFRVHDIYYLLSFQNPEDYSGDDESGGFGYGNGRSELDVLNDIAKVNELTIRGDSLTSAELSLINIGYEISDRVSGYNSSRTYVTTFKFNMHKAALFLTELEKELKEVQANKPIYDRKADILENVETIKSFINAIDDEAMEDMFGNHVRVVVTKESVSVDDYEHE